MKRKYILDNLKSRNSIQFYNKDDYMVMYGDEIIGVISKEPKEQYDRNKLYYIARIKDFDSDVDNLEDVEIGEQGIDVESTQTATDAMSDIAAEESMEIEDIIAALL